MEPVAITPQDVRAYANLPSEVPEALIAKHITIALGDLVRATGLAAAPAGYEQEWGEALTVRALANVFPWLNTFALDGAAKVGRLEGSVDFRFLAPEDVEARIGRKPALQYVGADSDQITLNGQILPEWKGSSFQLDLMRAQAGMGQPLAMISGSGRVLGDFVIQQIDDTQSAFYANGTARVIDFSMTLKEYGPDQGGTSDLKRAFGLVSAWAGVLS